MHNLALINTHHTTTLDSREVAVMVGKQHYDLMKSIRQFCEHLSKGDFSLADYFTPAIFVDTQGKERPRYDCTKKGCEMIAHKMTGERGTQFTAAYINRFHEMEARALPQSLPEALRLYADALEENKALQIELDSGKEWYSVKRVAALNDVSHKTFDWRRLKEESVRQGIGIRKIFDANYGEVNTYHQSVWESVYPEYEL